VNILRRVRAFEFVRSQTGKEQELMEQLLKIPQIGEVHLLTGEWDLMATITTSETPVDPREKIFDVVRESVRQLPLVRDTSTLIPAWSFVKEDHLARPERRMCAFVLLKTKSGQGTKVAKEVTGINEVLESYLLLGKSDVMAVLEFEKSFIPSVPEMVAQIVSNKIAKIGGIVSTETLLPLQSLSKPA